MENMTFLDEIILEAERADKVTRIELDRARADHILIALGRLDGHSEEVEKTAEAEINLIAAWKDTELSRIDKQRSFLTWQLEQYIKSTDEKTIRLAHGTLKLRLGRDKIEVVDIDAFMKVAKKEGLLRTMPEYQEPDLRLVTEYVKKTGEIPAGVELTPATTKFSYQLNGGSNGKATEA
jgi:hypothetical protein